MNQFSPAFIGWSLAAGIVIVLYGAAVRAHSRWRKERQDRAQQAERRRNARRLR